MFSGRNFPKQKQYLLSVLQWRRGKGKTESKKHNNRGTTAKEKRKKIQVVLFRQWIGESMKERKHESKQESRKQEGTKKKEKEEREKAREKERERKLPSLSLTMSMTGKPWNISLLF